MIKVTVVRFAGRDNLMLRYTDPVSGKRVHKSADTRIAKEAERAAERWQFNFSLRASGRLLLKVLEKSN